jgi:hypothetical protein
MYWVPFERPEGTARQLWYWLAQPNIRQKDTHKTKIRGKGTKEKKQAEKDPKESGREERNNTQNSKSKMFWQQIELLKAPHSGLRGLQIITVRIPKAETTETIVISFA